ncbi:hypothetical protein [Methylobacterium soli]|nr:hypothetical protein [Methylobacterium soli]
MSMRIAILRDRDRDRTALACLDRPQDGARVEGWIRGCLEGVR